MNILQYCAQQNHQNFTAPIVCAQTAEDDQIYLHFTAEASEEHNTWIQEAHHKEPKQLFYIIAWTFNKKTSSHRKRKKRAQKKSSQPGATYLITAGKSDLLLLEHIRIKLDISTTRRSGRNRHHMRTQGSSTTTASARTRGKNRILQAPGFVQENPLALQTFKGTQSQVLTFGCIAPLHSLLLPGYQWRARRKRCWTRESHCRHGFLHLAGRSARTRSLQICKESLERLRLSRFPSAASAFYSGPTWFRFPEPTYTHFLTPVISFTNLHRIISRPTLSQLANFPRIISWPTLSHLRTYRESFPDLPSHLRTYRGSYRGSFPDLFSLVSELTEDHFVTCLISFTNLPDSVANHVWRGRAYHCVVGSDYWIDV